MRQVRFPMAFAAMRFHDGELVEGQGEDSENRRLEEPDEHLKGHQRHRAAVWHEMGDNQQKDFASEYRAEKPEAKRDEARQIAYNLQKADDKVHQALPYGVPSKINKFRGIFQHAEREDSRELDYQKRDNRKRERRVEVGIDRMEKRQRLPVLVKSERAEYREEVEHV